MFKRVDGTVNDNLDGFSYLDYAGKEIRLELGATFISVYNEEYLGARICCEDVPKLILALQECLKHRQEESNID